MAFQPRQCAGKWLRGKKIRYAVAGASCYLLRFSIRVAIPCPAPKHMLMMA